MLRLLVASHDLKLKTFGDLAGDDLGSFRDVTPVPSLSPLMVSNFKPLVREDVGPLSGDETEQLKSKTSFVLQMKKVARHGCHSILLSMTHTGRTAIRYI